MAMATKRRHGQSASLWLAIAMEVRRREEISGVERHLEEGSSSTPGSVGDESMARRREPEKASWPNLKPEDHRGGVADGKMGRRRLASKR